MKYYAERILGSRTLPAALSQGRWPPAPPARGWAVPPGTEPASRICSWGHQPHPRTAPTKRHPRTRVRLHKFYREQNSRQALSPAGCAGVSPSAAQNAPSIQGHPGPRARCTRSGTQTLVRHGPDLRSPGTETPAFPTGHLRHLSPEEKKFKTSFCIFAAYGFVGLVSGSRALCRSPQPSGGGRDAAREPTPSPGAGRGRRGLSSLPCCRSHQLPQTTKSEKAGSACGSCGTVSGEERVWCCRQSKVQRPEPPQAPRATAPGSEGATSPAHEVAADYRVNGGRQYRKG